MRFNYKEVQDGFMSELRYNTVDKIKVPDRVPDKVPDRVPDNLTENQSKIIQLLKTNNRLSLADLGRKIGMSKRKVLDNMNVLKVKGRIERIGSPRGGYWKVIDKEDD